MNIKIHSNAMLSVSYGCKTCSRILGDERKLRVFENRVLKKILGTSRKIRENEGDRVVKKILGTSRKIRENEGHRVVKKILGTSRKIRENEGDCTTRRFMICKPHQIYLGR